MSAAGNPAAHASATSSTPASRPVTAGRLALEERGFRFKGSGGLIELEGPARAALTASELTRLPARLWLRSERLPELTSVTFGKCEASRLTLPAFDAVRPGPPVGRQDDAVVAVLHRGPMRFTNVDGTTDMSGSMLLIHRYFPECRFESDGDTDRIALRVPTNLLPSQAKHVVHPFLLYEKGAPGLPSIYERVIVTAMARAASLSLADRSRMQRTLANLVSDLIATGAEGAAEQQQLSLANLRGRALEYIERNLETITDVAEVAAAMRCSPRQLYKAFEERRTTPARFVWQRRLERAHERISGGTTETLAEIAYGLGFQSYAHFSRAYKRAFGAAPAHTARGG